MMVLSLPIMLRLLASSFLAVASISVTCAQVPAAAKPVPLINSETPANTAPPAAPAPAAPAPAATVPPIVVTPAPQPAVPAPTTTPARVTINRCNVEGPHIAITFDDGPHGVQTPRLLKMLRDRGIRATFFVVGSCVAENPEVARQIIKEGHEIANHSWSHPNLGKMGTESVRDQLGRTHNVIKQEVEVAPAVMRPPYGNFTTQQRAWAFATWGYQTIMWDVDSLDWKHRSPGKTESIILANTKPGSIILCHDIHATTIDAMPSTLDKLIAKGFKFATVSELIKMHREPAAPVKAAAARPLSRQEAEEAATSLDEIAKPPKRRAATKR
jgi:peptidoglycan/xylan/chitin deacetylase (PgdA/CDA1 family)